MRPRTCLLTLVIVSFASVAHAQLQNSTWDTNYRSNDGSVNVPCRLVLNGARGNYYPGGQVGQLYGVNYYSGGIISGYWQFSNVQGWFSFRVTPDGSRFQGSWGYGNDTGNPVGTWAGVAVGTPIPTPVPVPIPQPIPTPVPAPVPAPVPFPPR